MRVEILTRSQFTDARGIKTLESLKAIAPLSAVLVIDVYCLADDLKLPRERVPGIFADAVSQDCFVDRPAFSSLPKGWESAIEIFFKAGVTDPVGITAAEAVAMESGAEKPRPFAVQSGRQYVFYADGALSGDQREKLARALYNPLIQRAELRTRTELEQGKAFPSLYPAVSVAEPSVRVQRFSLAGMSDEDLVRLSRERLLALSLEEMRAIRDHFSDARVVSQRRADGIGEDCTDVELEMLAQTWSEHCKHKIFAAEIDYTDEAGRSEHIDGLFSTFIKKTTGEILKRRPDVRSVFHDNAGVVDFDDDNVVCFKVETHNSPSALDPYGGAITGIVGVNRDVLGTGKGAKPIFNTDVLCFADPQTRPEDLPEGLLPPARVMEGVHEGIIDGGNQSGIPTVGGAFLFDESYIGKPLVFCGTGGIMPRKIQGEESWLKRVDSGDIAVVIGGRFGKDGIHGATFSSLALDQDSPSSAVQIGDPITQRKVWDFLLEARDLGLYRGITDNGAGGISSSLGEMAQDCGGVEVDLEKCPLKYPGLLPWEIWVSESQERMSLAVPPSKLEALLRLSERRSVEATAIGRFTDSGFIDLRHRGERVALVKLAFVHEGLPRMRLKARWTSPEQRGFVSAGPSLGRVLKGLSLPETLRRVLSHKNVRSKESLVRHYDHEVQGGTISKPYQGKHADAPSDGAVLRPIFGKPRGLSITHGICPRVGDDDAYKMALAAVDEAYRSHIALGGDPDLASALDNFCWPDPVASADIPDGEFKLAQLVRANQGLRDACLAYGLPLISGKDSMKNDARTARGKISVRPTLLVSLMGIVPDTRKSPATGFINRGDSIYLLGDTGAEIGGSVLDEILFGAGPGPANKSPSVNPQRAAGLYRAVAAAIAEGKLRSIHDLSDGGLAVAAAEAAFFARLGFSLDLSRLVDSIAAASGIERSAAIAAALFSESPSRFLCSVDPAKEKDFLAVLPEGSAHRLGTVSGNSTMSFAADGLRVLESDIETALAAWKTPW